MTWVLGKELAVHGCWPGPMPKLAHGMGKRGILHSPDLCHVQASNPPATGLSHLQTTPVSYTERWAVEEWAEPSAGSERRKCLRRRQREDSNVILDSLRRGLARKIPLQCWR